MAIRATYSQKHTGVHHRNDNSKHGNHASTYLRRNYGKVLTSIHSANKIAIFGVRNLIVAEKNLSTKLLYLGLRYVRYDDYYLQKILASSLCKQDIAIGISYSGRLHTTQLTIVDMIYWDIILCDYDYCAKILDRNSRII